MRFRKTILIKDNKEIPFENLKRGDIFKLYEPDGEVVKDKKGNSIFVCTSEIPILLENGNYSVETKILKQL